MVLGNIDGWTDNIGGRGGWTEGWMDGWMDGWMNGYYMQIDG